MVKPEPTDPNDAPARAARELVDLYDPADPDGRVTGVTTRAQVRAGNLPHAATGVLLRDGHGRVFVHRRTDTKDVFPGAHDVLAGGVVGHGEDPVEAAARELSEELGQHGLVLHPVLRSWYRDASTHYLAHVFEAWWDGRPVVTQESEVAQGWWEPATELRDRLANSRWPFVPDTRALLTRWPDWWHDHGPRSDQ